MTARLREELSETKKQVTDLKTERNNQTKENDYE
jgi:hypothetical protein